jgi:hypothetical protein
VEQTERPATPDCRHHWVIQPATGPISPGVCQNCGETREFKNYVEASTWGEDKSRSRANADVTRTIANTAIRDEEGEE